MEKHKEYELAYSALANILSGDNVLSGNGVDSTDGTLYPDVREGLELATKLLLQCASERSNESPVLYNHVDEPRRESDLVCRLCGAECGKGSDWGICVDCRERSND